MCDAAANYQQVFRLPDVFQFWQGSQIIGGTTAVFALCTLLHKNIRAACQKQRDSIFTLQQAVQFRQRSRPEVRSKIHTISSLYSG